MNTVGASSEALRSQGRSAGSVPGLLPTSTLAGNWTKVIDCVRAGGPEQGMLDLHSGRIVFRYLHDDVWESEEVRELVEASPDRFLDLPHPSNRERSAWRAAFANEAGLRGADTKYAYTFAPALIEAGLQEAWERFEEQRIRELLVDWVERNELPVALLEEKKAKVKPSASPTAKAPGARSARMRTSKRASPTARGKR